MHMRAHSASSASSHRVYAFHPDSSFRFPKRTYGKTTPKMRACQAEYFKTWPWLTYDVEKDVLFCHLCVKSLRAKKMAAKRADLSYTQKGFTYWKDATIAFKKHASSDCHKEAVEVSTVLPRSCPGVGKCFHPSIRSTRKTIDSVF